MTRRGPRLAVLAGLTLGLLGIQRPGGLGDLVAVRHWSYPDYTRVVVELDRAVETQVEHLPADPGADRPERLYLDLDDIWVGRRFSDGIAVSDGLLRAVRIGQNTRRRTRVVIDVLHYQRHRLIQLRNPHRLVVDVYGPRDDGETLQWPARPGKGGPADDGARLRPELRPVRTVVLDPGHGGRDPGAVGIGGLREKDVTLKLAALLAPRLRERGFEVALTRHDDRSVSLEERTAIAEAARGDLFVSLHANAAPRRGLQGVETYYLDRDHQRHGLRVAARENGTPHEDLDALQQTLSRLRLSATSQHSRRLAGLVQGQIVAGLPGRYRPVQDLGVKKGPFYVLFLSDMPAILLEAGFVTNRTEARRLRDADYLTAMAEQIAEGLTRYREAGPQLALRGP